MKLNKENKLKSSIKNSNKKLSKSLANKKNFEATRVKFKNDFL